MFCTQCGTPATTNAVYCTKCGAALTLAPLSQESPALATNPTEHSSAAAQNRPWVRFWARMFDIYIFGLLVGFLMGIIAPRFIMQMRIQIEPVFLFGIITILPVFLWAFVEALLLSSFGTTPGKWLLKIKITQLSGGPITYSQALRRSLKVWWRGMGTGYPIAYLITLAVAYGRLTRNGITSWDKEGGFSVTHEKVGAVRVISAVAFFLAIIAPRVIVTPPGETQIVSALFGGIVLLIYIGIIWYFARKKQIHADARLQDNSTLANNHSAGDANSLEANEPKRSCNRTRAVRANKKNPSMQAKIILVLIIAALAIGSISYLYNARNHKIESYVIAKAVVPEKSREEQWVDAYAAVANEMQKQYGKSPTTTDDTLREKAKSLNNHAYLEELENMPYPQKVKQRFVIYSTSIIIVALGLSCVVLRPIKQSCKK